jgi:hypothetical protein
MHCSSHPKKYGWEQNKKGAVHYQKSTREKQRDKQACVTHLSLAGVSGHCSSLPLYQILRKNPFDSNSYCGSNTFRKKRGIRMNLKMWLQKKKKLNSNIPWPTNWVNPCSATTPGLQRTRDLEKIALPNPLWSIFIGYAYMVQPNH